jgi:hypothetical protein
MHCTFSFGISVRKKSHLVHFLNFISQTFIFRKWEEAGILEPGDEFDLYCLHFVCMEVISTALEDFTITRNNHKMGLMDIRPPRQIFIGGLLSLAAVSTLSLFR